MIQEARDSRPWDFRPSLRDLSVLMAVPRTDVLGYFHDVPAGLCADTTQSFHADWKAQYVGPGADTTQSFEADWKAQYVGAGRGTTCSGARKKGFRFEPLDRAAIGL